MLISFVVKFEIGKCELSSCSSFTRLLAILDPIHLHMSFRTILPIFPKKIFFSGIMRIITLNLYINFRTVTILKYCYLIHEHKISFHLFRSLNFYFNDVILRNDKLDIQVSFSSRVKVKCREEIRNIVDFLVTGHEFHRVYWKGLRKDY